VRVWYTFLRAIRGDPCEMHSVNVLRYLACTLAPEWYSVDRDIDANMEFMLRIMTHTDSLIQAFVCQEPAHWTHSSTRQQLLHDLRMLNQHLSTRCFLAAPAQPSPIPPFPSLIDPTAPFFAPAPATASPRPKFCLECGLKDSGGGTACPGCGARSVLSY
jgi:hypothetical protein